MTDLSFEQRLSIHGDLNKNRCSRDECPTTRPQVLYAQADGRETLMVETKNAPFVYSGKADPVTTSPFQASARLARAPFRARGRSNLNRLVVPFFH